MKAGVNAISAGYSARRLLGVLVLLSAGIFINYVDRGNLATAAPLIKTELGLSAGHFGFLLASFYITYVPMQILVGIIADRIGAAGVLLAGFIVFSAAQVLTGLAHTYSLMLVLRLLLGIGESASFPASSIIIARHFSEARRGMANAAMSAAIAAGPAFGVFVGALLIDTHGWRWFFVVFGLVSALWIVPWITVARFEREPLHVAAARRPDLRAILRQRSLWHASAGHFCACYVLYFVLSWIPYYLVHELGFSMAQMARMGGCAYLMMALASIGSGWLTDRWIGSGLASTRVRKSFLGAGCALAALGVCSCVAVGAQGAFVSLMAACVGLGLVTPNLYAVAQTLAGPGAAGRWVGIQNCIGNCAGLIAPFLSGVVADTTGSFGLAFLLAGAVSVCGGFVWIFGMGPLTRINWGAEGGSAAP